MKVEPEGTADEEEWDPDVVVVVVDVMGTRVDVDVEIPIVPEAVDRLQVLALLLSSAEVAPGLGC